MYPGSGTWTSPPLNKLVIVRFSFMSTGFMSDLFFKPGSSLAKTFEIDEFNIYVVSLFLTEYNILLNISLSKTQLYNHICKQPQTTKIKKIANINTSPTNATYQTSNYCTQ